MHRWWAERQRVNEARLLSAASQRYRDTVDAKGPAAFERYVADIRNAVGDERATVIVWEALVAVHGEEEARAMIERFRAMEASNG
jgi:hypothetical protein